MNEYHPLEKLRQAELSNVQQQRLFSMIETLFKRAIDARSPRKRPPGKAGLRAEKGYYRLLYLEGTLHETVDTRESPDTDTPAYRWDAMRAILRQLSDIPGLQSEILAGIDAALVEVTKQAPRG